MKAITKTKCHKMTIKNIKRILRLKANNKFKMMKNNSNKDRGRKKDRMRNIKGNTD